VVFPAGVAFGSRFQSADACFDRAIIPGAAEVNRSITSGGPTIGTIGKLAAVDAGGIGTWKNWRKSAGKI
jgi:hypothetical protein